VFKIGRRHSTLNGLTEIGSLSIIAVQIWTTTATLYRALEGVLPCVKPRRWLQADAERSSATMDATRRERGVILCPTARLTHAGRLRIDSVSRSLWRA
jgi:hypothetical protein